MEDGRAGQEPSRNGIVAEMNQRRSRPEVIADILRLKEAGKTVIMYKANMTHRQLEG